MRNEQVKHKALQEQWNDAKVIEDSEHYAFDKTHRTNCSAQNRIWCKLWTSVNGNK